MGVLMASSWLFRDAKCPFIGVRGSSEGSGENGLVFEENEGVCDVQMEIETGRAGILGGGCERQETAQWADFKDQMLNVAWPHR